MSKRQILSLVGVWVMVFLFLGFPSSWQKGLALISGLGIILMAYNLPQSENKTEEGKGESDKTDQNTFIENK